MPSAAMIAPATKAAVNPSTSALGTAVPEASASSVRELAIVDSAAIPSAPPICCDVLIRPDARPASDGATPASAAIENHAHRREPPRRNSPAAAAF